MKEKTCCFTGHREIDNDNRENINDRLFIEMEALISKGITNFISGGAQGFDLITASRIVILKHKYSDIKLTLALPYKGHHKSWNEADQSLLSVLIKKANKVIYVSDHYYNGCMHTRNRYMVDNSAYCICYLKKDTGGTAYTVSYAKKKGLEIIKI